MQKIFLTAAIACSVAACQSASDSKTETSADTTAQQQTLAATADTGWLSLFDGQSLNGWHSYGKPAPGAAWNVDSNAIHLSVNTNKGYQSEGGGDLVSTDEYGNFDLKLEWKISKNGNSGIVFFICQVAWIQRNRIGLTFVETHGAADISLEGLLQPDIREHALR